MIWFIVLAAYLLGSLSPGSWIAARYQRNLRQVGSGNTGATNVLRTLGWGPAVLVALFDGLKGGVAVEAARLLGGAPLLLAATALAAVLGHNYSLFLRFRGGKGVSTTLGALIFLDPALGSAVLIIALSVMALTRYVSAGSLTTGISGVLLAWIGDRPVTELLVVAVLGGLIFWTHRGNLSRLQSGSERRIGERS